MTPTVPASRRRVRTAAVVLATAGALGLTACGGGGDPLASSSSSADDAGGSGEIVVGSADFSESILLAHIYAGALKADGINASTKTGIGSREVYLKALDEGSVDVMPEYTGGLALYYDKDFAETDPDKTYEALEDLLPEGTAVLEKSAAEDKDSIVVTRETAEGKSLKTMDDLSEVAGELTLGAPSEFKTRSQGIPGLKESYGIEFKTFRPLKAGQATSGALKNGQIDAANIFSTDPSIAANDFVVLEDTKKLFGSQNVVPLVRSDVQEEVQSSLDEVSAKLTTDKLAELLKRTDIDKEDPDQVAADFLKEEGLD
ncbi:ABC transporter substrate-binding protein [Janibacter hoylei]|uniref:Glycine/betaine ABC transporter substrate-binding protein n=1 Tax=Janibacter hoylei PVAS-1 TaxID=1210046 RepID=K1DX44_9MICO|nr:ABC transporter substrate-binding protein [Janibacter hoylei]EKA60969.1 substrate-binding region of ABC-type glycine betaine transporter [Janibacter hoylei PVAS-1]MCW4601406.1 ABC transporter substrate-binding protein [Janibacter hoylei]RWU83014.1 glycine/betaine ABC transporter substrate-binding protein [Janibacter hoylei PVAS-1]